MSLLLFLSVAQAPEGTPPSKPRAEPHPSPARDAPWQAGIDTFLDGDMTGALALEDACAKRRVARCGTKATQMREFLELYNHLDDLDAKGLGKLIALDKDITDERRSKLTRTVGIKLATDLCKAASSAKAVGQYARAGELAKRALEADPGDNCAASILEDLKTKPHELREAPPGEGDVPAEPGHRG